ncbi:MAG: 50S ribosomal protein L11 methyltransferase [Helicobacter sp.]|nr:50S ribosomal protein L11 methyltransferase [Helicobacter sp.]
MTEFYYKLIIAPCGFYDLFASKLLEFGPIEEIDTTNPLHQMHEIDARSDLGANLGQYLASFEEIIPSKEQTGPTKFLSVATTGDLKDELDALKSLLEECIYLAKKLEVNFYYKIQKLKNQDWIDSYKRGIRPVICEFFYIRPPWCEPLILPNKGAKYDVLIEPSLAFGTGHHESTSLVLQTLCTLDLKDKSLLDIGSGSGILGICASFLGAKITACDVDLDAVNETKKNFSLNKRELTKIWHGGINDIDLSSFDVFTINIEATIIKMLYNFLRFAKEGSRVILSGILHKYEHEILKCFEEFTCERTLQKGEWICFSMIKK